MSALPPKADIASLAQYVRFVPQGDIRTCSKIAAYRAPSPFGSWFDQSPDQRLFKSLAAFAKCRAAAACSDNKSVCPGGGFGSKPVDLS
jgi:hypothetical protein